MASIGDPREILGSVGWSTRDMDACTEDELEEYAQEELDEQEKRWEHDTERKNR